MKIIKAKNLLIFLLLLQMVLLVQSSAELSVIDQIPEPRIGGTLIDSSTADAQVINPVVSYDATSHKIEELIFEGLLTYDQDMNIVSKLASRWLISTNKLDYTFKLRDNVYWHDGEKFTAEDVIFTWDRLLDPETDTYHDFMFDLLDLDNVPYEMIDDYTVIFHLQTTSLPMLKHMMFPIIPEHVYENHDGVDGIKSTSDDCRDTYGTYTFNDDPVNKNPIGTGPMMFFEWELNDHITLIRNSIDNGGPSYWHDHDAYLDSYMLKIIADINVQLISLRNGAIHMMDLSYISQTDIDDIIADPNITVYSYPSFTSDHIALQTDPSKGNLYGLASRDFTSNPNHFAGYEWQTAENPEIYGHLVRKALNYGLDKQGLIEYVFPQGSRNLGPMYLAQYEWYNDQVEPYDYDLEMANNLLEQAGFGATADDPLRCELDFSISFNQGNLRRDKFCQFARDQWASLGITVTIESLAWVTMLSTHYDGRNFDAMAASWTGGGDDPDLTNIWSSSNIMPGGEPTGLNLDGTWIWSGTPYEGGLNYVSYWNNAVDSLMDAALNEEEFDIRKTYYDQIQEMIVDDSPYIWLYSHVFMKAINADFCGFVQDSVAGFWPEPVGFRNIFYAYGEELPITTTTISDSSSVSESESSSSTINFHSPGFAFWQLLNSFIVIGIIVLIKRQKK